MKNSVYLIRLKTAIFLSYQLVLLLFLICKHSAISLGLWPRYLRCYQPWPLATLLEVLSALAFGHAT
ncbi:MAG: hypothetical protein F6J90_12470 [Moorea sp. SIOASIH]|uniref:hypothetical protein n=1 Tax=Moorena sp. SIOASIH TaxID=2607817 RepID=UPI0013B9A994|nr:hypothetical protein [Moorena sp. SIOASIH]NEO37081.1 hypothetical protein [Moorena sp. SIOASIH]